MKNDEAQLIVRAKRGDSDAFAEIYNRHHAAVYTYILWRVNDRLATEDLTGEVFVRLVGKIKTVKPRKKPILAWLYTVARNLVIDYQRKQAKTPLAQLEESLPAQNPGPHDAAERRMIRDCLEKAMRHLTDDQRLVVLNRLILDFSTREVANLMDKKEGAIKSLQHRALAALKRAVLKERCYEPRV